MPTIADLRNLGTDFLLPSRRLPEPINAPTPVKNRLSRFSDEIYSLHRDSHLYRYLTALCGDAGAGRLKHSMLYPRLQQMIESTHFGDLDRLFGNPLGLPRLQSLDYLGNPVEVYDGIDPVAQVLTQAQWALVKARDANYRARCQTWMRAILKGPTLEGIALAAEAALGIECDVFENYQYIENQASDDPITLPNLGTTSSPNEVVIIPRAPDITQEERRRIINLIDVLRPVDTVPTVFSGDRVRTERPILEVAATSTGFTVQRFVTGRTDLAWPEIDLNEAAWIEAGVTKEAPTAAWLDREEAATFVTLASVSGSTTHVGKFNEAQQSVFPYLTDVTDPFYTFSPDNAAAFNFAALSFTTTWVNR